MKLYLATLVLPLAVGCSGSQPQVLTGRVAAGFPTAIAKVNIMQGATVVSTAPVAADGSFRLSVPAGSGYAVRLVGAGQTGLVFPRHAGTIAKTFSIKGGGVAFDLGGLFYVGNSGATSFVFHDSGTGGACDGEDHDGSGATCVDDGDTTGGACDGGDNQQEADGSDGSDSGSDAAEAPDAGDAVAEHNFPADGCADGNDNGGDDNGGGTADGSGA